ncbi:MAG: hypothetical protein K2X03_22070 [Bryobacteraceae bacterium]|nr:hypothetical protein [Bryobacteraceae bacterium]
MLRPLLAILALAVFAFAADVSGADVTGEWKATAEGPDGRPMTRTFKFVADGQKVTGESVSSIVGKSMITDGHLDGDHLTFTLHIEFQGNEMTSKYNGKIVNKDKIIFKIEGLQGGEDFHWIAVRAPAAK